MTFAYVTSTFGEDTASGTSLNATVVSVTTGQMVVVSVGWETSDSTSSVTDTAGNVYTPLTKRASTTVSEWVRLFYCISATGNASNVVNVAHGTSVPYRTIEVGIYSHDGSAAFDNEGWAEQAAGSNPTVVSSTLTPTGAGSNLLVGADRQFNAAAWTPAASFTNTNPGSSLYCEQDYRIVTGTSGISGGGQAAASTALVYAYAIFKEGAAGNLAWITA